MTDKEQAVANCIASAKYYAEQIDFYHLNDQQKRWLRTTLELLDRALFTQEQRFFTMSKHLNTGPK